MLENSTLFKNEYERARAGLASRIQISLCSNGAVPFPAIDDESRYSVQAAESLLQCLGVENPDTHKAA